MIRTDLWALSALFLAACTGAGAQDVPPVEPPAPIRLETVTPTELRPVHQAHGVLRAGDAAMVAFLEGGRLAERPVEVGQRVTVGDVVARLDDPGTRNAVRGAQASVAELEERLAQLERDRERSATLAREGVATNEELERVESGLARTRSALEGARAQLGETRRRRAETVVRAPFSGVVTDVLADPGELLGPGQPVIRLVGEGGLEVIVRVTAELAAELEPGASAPVRIAVGDPTNPLARETVEGRIVSVAGASALGGMHPVRIAIDRTEGIAAGQGVVVELAGAPREVATVPLGAVQDPSGTHPFVWVDDEGRASRAAIRLGALQGDRVVVLDGLAAGTSVVVAGHTRLLPGDALEGAVR
ncbi:MAG: efflux RND transporter periplasmic adaptor subunit [Deltaproteobacteria bacterium]|nr:efflux RND transporter periplasmic adaptor subunit [Deltaproteobacteria bacterium]